MIITAEGTEGQSCWPEPGDDIFGTHRRTIIGKYEEGR